LSVKREALEQREQKRAQHRADRRPAADDDDREGDISASAGHIVAEGAEIAGGDRGSSKG
jgi:hypothetical protein